MGTSRDAAIFITTLGIPALFLAWKLKKESPAISNAISFVLSGTAALIAISGAIKGSQTGAGYAALDSLSRLY